MTWKEFMEFVKKEGVQDDDMVDAIDINSPTSDSIRVGFNLNGDQRMIYILEA